MALCEPRPPPTPLENRQAANKTTAVIVPALLIGVVGYATWIVVVLIGGKCCLFPKSILNWSWKVVRCESELLCAHAISRQTKIENPSLTFLANHLIKYESRNGAGIAIIVLYFVFLFPMASSYLRLLITIPHPGYIEKGSPTAATPVKPAKEAPPQHNIQASCTSTKVQDGTNQTSKKSQHLAPKELEITELDIKAILSGELPPPPGTERFYSKDVFACDQNGLPIWCGVCSNWKPDRSHHGSDFGRCVLKMDHFCPVRILIMDLIECYANLSFVMQWVGGVVGERNFNFFIQFCSYAGIYALYVMIVMAYFVAEARGRVSASFTFFSTIHKFLFADSASGQHTRRQLDCWVDTWSCVYIVRRRHGDD